MNKTSDTMKRLCNTHYFNSPSLNTRSLAKLDADVAINP